MKYKKKLKQLQKDVDELKQLLRVQQNPHTEVWLDSADIKQQFNFSESKLYRLRKNLQIPYTLIGGRYFYPKSYFNKVLIEKIRYKDKIE